MEKLPDWDDLSDEVKERIAQIAEKWNEFEKTLEPAPEGYTWEPEIENINELEDGSAELILTAKLVPVEKSE